MPQNTILTFTPSALLTPLGIATLAALLLLLVLIVRRPLLARIAWRNVPRRRMQTVLIVLGLMLATMFIASSLAIDDTITLAVKSVAIFNLGRIDEDVTGGNGPLGLYSDRFGAAVIQRLTHDPHLAGIAPALVIPNVLVADEASRQVRGQVTSFALDPTAAGALGDLRDASGAAAPVSALGPGAVYLNHNTSVLLHAAVGDQVQISSPYWLGQAARFRVQAIVSGGPLGDTPAIVLPLAVQQQLAQATGEINHIYVANTGDGLSGVGYSNTAVREIRYAVRFRFQVRDVKQDGVRFALDAEQIFGRILTLYTLFAMAIGMLLIFLIFVLLATERRAELGMARAIGMRRLSVAQMLLFEGAAYDGMAALLGIVAGLGLSAGIVVIVAPTLRQIGYPLQFALQPGSLLLALCLGLLFTLATIWLAVWSASRMTIAAALRNLPEPTPAEPGLLTLATASISALGARRPGQALRVAGHVVVGLASRGLVPALAGWYLLTQGAQNGDALIFSLGLTLLAVGIALLARWALLTLVVSRIRRRPDAPLRLARWQGIANRATAFLAGSLLVLYWSLPFDALANLGLPRFQGAGIQIFFIAGAMQVAGAVWALAPNLDLLLLPLRWLLDVWGAVRAVARVALVYPAQYTMRTGIALALFSLVCFTMVVMATIAASTTQRYDNLPAQSAQYDIVGQPLLAPLTNIAAVQSAITRQSPATANAVTAIAQATPLLLGYIHPAEQGAHWELYPTAQISGAFLQGAGLPLVARARGYPSDAAVWSAVRNDPGAVVIDTAALSPADAATLGITLPAPPGLNQFLGPPIIAALPGFVDTSALATATNQAGSAPGTSSQQAAQFAAYGAIAQGNIQFALLRLHGIATGSGSFAPTTLWAGDFRGGGVTQLHVVGIVDNTQGQRYGVMGSPATFAPLEHGLTPFGNNYYYFKVRAGSDPHQIAAALGSALFDQGFETTVLQDVLLDTGGPRVFISRVLVGLVGLTLLVGTAALAVTGARAVVERRQQIGMLRALGMRRWKVQAIFLMESLLIGAIGTLAGLVLGLLLCRNIFAVDFFEPLQTGLTLVIPWTELAIICTAAIAAAAIAALLPAWQAGRVRPADALRYE